MDGWMGEFEGGWVREMDGWRMGWVLEYEVSGGMSV